MVSIETRKKKQEARGTYERNQRIHGLYQIMKNYSAVGRTLDPPLSRQRVKQIVDNWTEIQEG